MKTYFYASYMLNVNEPDVCAIIKAQSQAQIIISNVIVGNLCS